MNFIRHAATTPASTLLLLLPGAYMTPQQFVDAGFVRAAAMRGRGVDLAIAAVDVVAAADGSLLPALRAEIQRARQAGYAAVWLGGISLGGFLALLHAARHPGEVDGLCLFAPYPGGRITLAAIARAGGLAAWTPDATQRDDPELEVWDWLRRAPAALPIHIDYGRDDRFATGMAQLAAALPRARTTTRAGGHDWPVWQAGWEALLDSGWPATGSAP